MIVGRVQVGAGGLERMDGGGVRAEVENCRGERGIAVAVLGVDVGACIEQRADQRGVLMLGGEV